MIFYLITGTIGWTYYLTKESVLFFYNIYKNRKRERRLLLLEDKLKEQRALIYNLQFDLEEKNNPESTHGFELINDE
jgi:hypothetical protein